MAPLIAWILKPSNLIIAALAVALGLTWFGYQGKKVELAGCRGELGICQKDVAGFQAEVASMNGIIGALKANLEGIRKQMDAWRRIAAEAEDYSRRILAAAEGRRACEVENAELAKIAVDITDSFNRSVRRKVSRPASSDRGAAGEVLPEAGAPGAYPAGAGRKDDRDPGIAR